MSLNNVSSASLSILIFCMPNWLLNVILKKMHPKLHKIRVGFSWINVINLNLEGHVIVGHFNYITCNNLKLSGATIGHMNRLNGLFDVDVFGAVGNLNIIKNSNSTHCTRLSIGLRSKITSRHYLDLSANVTLEKDTLLAGQGSQIWTHSYGYHKDERHRIDGDVLICCGTYIGSRSILQGPVYIAPNVTIGSGTTISGKIECSNTTIVSASNRILKIDNEAMNKRYKFYKTSEESEPCIKKIIK